ncbi:glycosyltransferase [Vibrio proteolyticus]|uniref:Putative glycosyltransferase n=1 Tax=Vibrio proteolyticus NBRC 13287 TaxID=1219065 RepID=U2ZCD1_VIBPR|nr:glycosyltransferase [Vibrio proteolyticus]GAD65346.1 putative glycosyltransferase [Vibrio proteolyticus NBRC 13287]
MLTPLKKTVIHVVQYLAPGGIEAMALDFLSFAAPSEHVLIVSLEGDKNTALRNWPKLAPFADQLIFLGKPPGVHFALIRRIAKLLKLLRANVVHTHHIGPLLYAGIAARLARVPHRIHTEHDAWHLESPRRFLLQKWILEMVKPCMVADADLIDADLRQRFPRSDIVTIKNGVDCNKFKPGSQSLAREYMKLPKEVCLIGCAGRLEAVKGQDILIKALTYLPPEIHLVFAGSGSELARLQRLARHCQVHDQVIFLGLVNSMPRFYQSLDLYCMPSRQEGLPLAPLEAQACNIPVIASDVGATRETLCPDSGTLIHSESPLELAAAILYRIMLAERATPRAFVVKHHDVRQMISAYAQLSKEDIA